MDAGADGPSDAHAFTTRARASAAEVEVPLMEGSVARCSPLPNLRDAALSCSSTIAKERPRPVVDAKRSLRRECHMRTALGSDLFDEVLSRLSGCNSASGECLQLELRQPAQTA